MQGFFLIAIFMIGNETQEHTVFLIPLEAKESNTGGFQAHPTTLYTIKCCSRQLPKMGFSRASELMVQRFYGCREPAMGRSIERLSNRAIMTIMIMYIFFLNMKKYLPNAN